MGMSGDTTPSRTPDVLLSLQILTLLVGLVPDGTEVFYDAQTRGYFSPATDVPDPVVMSRSGDCPSIQLRHTVDSAAVVESLGLRLVSTRIEKRLTPYPTAKSPFSAYHRRVREWYGVLLGVEYKVGQQDYLSDQDSADAAIIDAFTAAESAGQSSSDDAEAGQ